MQAFKVNKYDYIIISGPSGSGKTTVINYLLQNKKYLRLSVSHTTRKMRIGEVDGEDYHFITDNKFKSMIANKFFYEYEVFNGCYYGTSFDEINEKSKVILFDWEQNGVLTGKRCNLNAYYIFIYCEKEVIRDRLTERMKRTSTTGLDVNELNQRLKSYDSDVELWRSGIYDATIVNDDINELRSKTLNAVKWLL